MFGEFYKQKNYIINWSKMKRTVLMVLILFFSTVCLSGCDEKEENHQELPESESNFYGTWKAESGSLSVGDSIHFDSNYNCSFFWGHGGAVHHNGTWRTTVKNYGEDILIITLGEQETVYEYDFLNSYTTLKLKVDGSNSYNDYTKQ